MTKPKRHVTLLSDSEPDTESIAVAVAVAVI